MVSGSGINSEYMRSLDSLMHLINLAQVYCSQHHRQQRTNRLVWVVFDTLDRGSNIYAIAIYNLWNWGWTFQGVTINNCQVSRRTFFILGAC